MIALLKWGILLVTGEHRYGNQGPYWSFGNSFQWIWHFKLLENGLDHAVASFVESHEVMVNVCSIE